MNNNNIVIENAKIRFKNFSGKAGKFNDEGKRNFCVLMEDNLANILIEEGYNVKYLNSLDEEEPPQAYIQVNVNFSVAPPKVILVSSRGQTALTEETVNVLDYADLAKVDVVLRPYNWSKAGKSGVKPYLKTMYATLDEDPLEVKYADAPDSALDSLMQQ